MTILALFSILSILRPSFSFILLKSHSRYITKGFSQKIQIESIDFPETYEINVIKQMIFTLSIEKMKFDLNETFGKNAILRIDQLLSKSQGFNYTEFYIKLLQEPPLRSTEISSEISPNLDFQLNIKPIKFARAFTDAKNHICKSLISYLEKSYIENKRAMKNAYIWAEFGHAEYLNSKNIIQSSDDLNENIDSPSALNQFVDNSITQYAVDYFVKLVKNDMPSATEYFISLLSNITDGSTDPYEGIFQQ
jgi:hypothetical protein